MPSFATEVKNELVRASTRKTCCQNAELAALLRMGASMTIGPAMNLGLNFVTENAAVARRVLQLLKANGQVKPEVTVSRAKRLKKNNSYFLRVAPSPQVRPLMESLGMLGDNEGSVGHDKGLLRRQCCRKAYLRGAFLGGGTVNRPEAKAHLEFVANSYPFANTLMQVLKKMDFPVGITDRKNNYQVYMKDGEEIMDLLAMLGAPKAVEQLEVARNLREVRNQVNRLVNCETANLQRTVSASVAQVEAIHQLESRGELDKLPPKMAEMARLRLAEPDASLSELGEMLGISRGAAANRLRKIMSLANSSPGEVK